MRLLLILGLIAMSCSPLAAQPLGEPDRASPGDAMIQRYLARETAKLEARFDSDVQTLADWQAKRPEYVEQYYYMLGLSPRPEKTPLQATITGTVEGDGYVVDLLHYQSRPGLYVTGNLYRPKSAKAGERHPAVFYVCGHSGRGRNGNKVAFQSHGIWFARHGYVCLIVDTLQLGEIAAFHHGTYNLNRWWWHSRGYTPAGVEAWNGIRGIDYLVSRDDVDAERIAVTGISGGGAATFWIAAADERVQAAVPVSGMADLESYVPSRVINGHCDCMFLYNTFQWPWTRIAGLVAPRPLLFVNSDNDPIFPMDANERVNVRLERLYRLYGAGDRVDAVVSVGGHAYRQDIRQATFRFINAHLKGDARPIDDSEIDVVSEGGNPGPYPIEPERLRVFPTDGEVPADAMNATIDETFVPAAKVELPKAGEYAAWKSALVGELRRVSFSYFPDEIPAATKVADSRSGQQRLQTEEGIEVHIRFAGDARPGGKPILLAVVNADSSDAELAQLQALARPGEELVVLQARGVGPTKWTQKNPPNYVERSHALLGRTVDAGRVWDVAAVAKYLSGGRAGEPAKVRVAGARAAGVLAAYAAVLEESIAEVVAIKPPVSHEQQGAPQLLNVLRVLDVPQALGLISPRPLRIVTQNPADFQATQTIYQTAAADQVLVIATPKERED